MDVKPMNYAKNLKLRAPCVTVEKVIVLSVN